MESRLVPGEIEHAIWIATAIAAAAASILAALTFRVQRFMTASPLRGVTVAMLAVGDYVVARLLLSAVAERLLGSLAAYIVYVDTGLVPVLTPLISMAVTWVVLSRRAGRGGRLQMTGRRKCRS